MDGPGATVLSSIESLNLHLGFMQLQSDEPAARFASACVLSSKGAQLLDSSRLAAIGLRIRTSPACMADVLITSASLAIIFLEGSELNTCTSEDAEMQWNRC